MQAFSPKAVCLQKPLDMHIKSFTFNPFSENTYVLSDATGECVIIDPGCANADERLELMSYLQDNKLKPVKLLNTHCHIDHVLGNKWVANTFGLGLEMHELDLPMLDALMDVARMYGVPAEPSPAPAKFINEGQSIVFGSTTLDIFFTPGHSPGSVVFFNKETKQLIAGDVLFYESIGRTDLPGGEHQTLLNSIRQKLWPLPDETVVHPGHGPSTTIGHEKTHNPFLQ